MIKRKQLNTKQQLLKESEEDSSSQYQPFEIEYCESIVDIDNEDRSYYCLENEKSSNPYFLANAQKQAQQRLNRKQFRKIEPQRIAMNGNHYQRINNETVNKNTEQIKAVCGACNTFQLIPKGSPKFYCYACRTLNKCMMKSQQNGQSRQNFCLPLNIPSNKLFICGHCLIKVSYQPGTSQYIRCSRCNTVNMVPK